MINANNRRSATFTNRTVATLQILLKLRLATELLRILVRVLERKNGQYKLQCQYGRLTSRHQGEELNHVDARVGETISANIRTKPEKNKGKELTIKLPGAVAQMNNRGTVTSAQIASRVPKIGAKSAAKPQTKPAWKPAQKPVPKPAQKPDMKRKRAEVEDKGGEGKEPSLRQLRSRIY